MRVPPLTPYVFYCEVLKVLDGDTLRLRIDQGFDDERRIDLRLVGYDAAELKDAPRGPLARDRVVLKMAEIQSRPGFRRWAIWSQKDRAGGEKMSFARYLGVLAAAMDDGAGGLRFEPVNETLYETLKAESLLRPGSRWNPTP